MASERIGKGVVYTCLFGGNEELAFKAFEGSICDFVAITDDKIEVPDNVSVLHVPTSTIGASRQSRRAKALPFDYFQSYDWSLYVDNRLAIKSPPEFLAEEYLLFAKKPFLCFEHPWRDCVYDEAEIVIQEGIDRETDVREQIDSYAQSGFPKNFGLSALTALLRNHNDPNLIPHHREWYEHILRFSKRDQLSFDFLRWKYNLEIGYFPFNLLDNEHFEWKTLHRVPKRFDPKLFAWREQLGNVSDREANKNYLNMNKPRDSLYAPHLWELNRLFNKYKSDKGTIYYNAHGYGFVYEFVLNPLKKKPVSVLEVGLLRHDIQSTFATDQYDEAPSLLAWAEYFQSGYITGFDIKDFSDVSLPENVSIFQGDSSNPVDIQCLVKLKGRAFDVVIDDGSHASHHQQIFLDNIFEHVAPGGFIFIEDLHYQPPELEKADAPKTLDVLKAIARGDSIDSPYISRSRQRFIGRQCTHIRFWDSRESVLGKVSNDALCCLQKLG